MIMKDKYVSIHYFLSVVFPHVYVTEKSSTEYYSQFLEYMKPATNSFPWLPEVVLCLTHLAFYYVKEAISHKIESPFG